MLPSTRELLRKARGLACDLRNVLDEVQGDLDNGRETDEDPLSSLWDNTEAAGEIESWLDSLKINEDGSSADEVMNDDGYPAKLDLIVELAIHPAIAVLMDLGVDFDEQFDTQVVPHLLALPKNARYKVYDDETPETYEEEDIPKGWTYRQPTQLAFNGEGYVVSQVTEYEEVDEALRSTGRFGIVFSYCSEGGNSGDTIVVPV